MPTRDLSVFRDTQAILGESLVWDPTVDATQPAGAMLWCDITAGVIHRSPLGAPADGTGDITIALPPPVASFHPAEFDGVRGYVVSLGDRVVLVDDSGRIARDLATVPHAHDGLRLNEGKVDPAGRWVTGSMDLTRKDPDGAFYSVSPSGELRLLLGGIAVGNGLEWSEDGSWIWFTDTGAGTVYRGAYSANGEITEVEPFLLGAPHDGLAMTADGSFWGALYGESRVVHYDAAGGELEHVELPVPNVTSVAFGGPGLETLYVASARENLTEQQLESTPLSGAIFALETGSTGRAPRTFRAA